MSSQEFGKSWPSAPDGFFDAEARGLRWLAEAPGGPPVPRVIAVDRTGITIERISHGAPTEAAAEGLGVALAALHRSGAPAFGASWPGFIGPLPMPNDPSPGPWRDWYAESRVLPFLRLAVDSGAVAGSDRRAIESACEHLPPGDDPPARIHGDLWSGNVVWSTDGRGWLIDAAAHGGHRETDLAMLALFGTPHLDQILVAYDGAWPLADGWRQRTGVHQLHPLLVHAALFGGGYGARAAAAARDWLAAVS